MSTVSGWAARSVPFERPEEQLLSKLRHLPQLRGENQGPWSLANPGILPSGKQPHNYGTSINITFFVWDFHWMPIGYVRMFSFLDVIVLFEDVSSIFVGQWLDDLDFLGFTRIWMDLIRCSWHILLWIFQGVEWAKAIWRVLQAEHLTERMIEMWDHGMNAFVYFMVSDGIHMVNIWLIYA